MIEKENMAVKAVTFDLEGTLVDLEKLHHAGHLYAARRAGLRLSLAAAVEKIPHFVGGPDEKIAEEIASLCPGSTSAASILSFSQSRYQSLLARRRTLRPRRNCLAVVRQSKKVGLAVAIASVTPRREAMWILKNSGLWQEFALSPIICREDVANRKPSPDCYLEAASRLGISPTEQLVFEDSVGGVLAARQSGAWVIAMPLVRSANYLQKLVLAGAWKVYGSWARVDLDRLMSEIQKEHGIGQS